MQQVISCKLKDLTATNYSMKDTIVYFEFISKANKILLPDGSPLLVSLSIDIRDASSIISTLYMPQHNPVAFSLYPIQNRNIFGGKIILYNNFFIIDNQSFNTTYLIKIDIDYSDKQYLVEYLSYVLFVELLGQK